MKKLITALFGLLLSSLAFAQLTPYSMLLYQADSGGGFYWGRILVPPSSSGNYMLVYDGSTAQPKIGLIGAGLSWDGSTFSSTVAAQVNTDWTAVSGVAQILNKPSTFPPAAHTHDAADVISGTLAVARLPALAIAQTTGLQAGLNAKFDIPSGSAAQYVRGDGTLATLPSAYAFDFGFPAARTLAVSTSYQATNTAKAAVIYPSYACQNATQVLASSACTLQVRVHTSAVTCSTGTVLYTQSLTVGLGLLITQNSTNPVPIFLPAGAHFIVCPSAGTFSITATEQSVG